MDIMNFGGSPTHWSHSNYS